MKKIVSIFLVLIVISLTFSVYATENPPTSEDVIDLNFERTAMDDEKVTVQISIGDFGNVSAPAVMSASFTYSYNSNISRIEGQGLNGWDITISGESNRVMLESDAANPNTTIAELTFYFSQDITESTNGSIEITELNLSDGNVYDHQYTDSFIYYTIEGQSSEAPTSDEPETPTTTGEEQNQNSGEEVIPEQNIVINTNGDSNNSQSAEEVNSTTATGESQNRNSDDTVSPDAKLPQTGLGIAVIVAIVVLAILGIVGLIRFKQIQIK